MKKIIEYYTTSLEQASLSEVKPTKNKSLQISFQDYLNGEVKGLDTKIMNRLFEEDEEEIEVFLFPIQMQSGSGRTEKRLYPLIVPACLSKNGELKHVAYGVPWIPRTLLAPVENSKLDVIGENDDYLQFIESHSFRELAWDEYVQLTSELFEYVTNQKITELKKISWFKKVDNHTLVFKGTSNGGAAQRIVKLYDSIAKYNGDLPLLENFLSEMDNATEPNLLAEDKQIEMDKFHFGQMKPTFGLSISQREVVRHMNTLNTGEMIGVTGPPGTGKTTLLQSIIATNWIKAAIEGKQPPICVVSSTNNQAVTNVIESFQMDGSQGTSFDLNQLPNFPEFHPLKENFCLFEERWIPTLDSYGLYIVNKKKYSEESLASMHAKISSENTEYLDRIESIEFFENAKAHFLSCFEDTFNKKGCTVQQVKEEMHSWLVRLANDLQKLVACNPKKGTYNKSLEEINNQLQKEEQLISRSHQNIDTLKAICTEWEVFNSKSGSILDIIPYLKQKREKERKQKFCQLNELESIEELENLLEKERQIIDASLTKRNQLKKGYEDLKIEKQHYQKLLGEYHIATAMDDIEFNEQLDKTIRYLLFVFTTHYWEAEWLISIGKLKEKGKLSNSIQNMNEYQQRWVRSAMLTPCIVGTLYQVPVFFSYDNKPMFNFIDLFITDESGQVSPEISTASLSLAKKYLAVGDTKQIEPIWNMTKEVDKGNILNLLTASQEGMSQFINSGLSTSCGNLMEVAQRRSKFHKYAHLNGGLFLSEHRRCLPEIIAYCNTLAYDGKLEPKREEKEAYYDGKLPPMGYGHIGGKMIRKDNSMANIIEAKAIASWIKDEKDNLLKMYHKHTIGDVVAVVTPFKAQKNIISSELKKLGFKEDEIVVGTVHALQGAEKSVVIFSTVYDIAYKGTYFFDRSVHMLNVAVSRAKDSFLIFGDTNIFNLEGNLPSTQLAKIIFSSENNAIHGLEKYTRISEGNIQRIEGVPAHDKYLVQLLNRTEEIIHIVSPYISYYTLDNYCQKLLNLMKQKVNAGKEIFIYTTPAINQSRKSSYTAGRKLLEETGARLIDLNRVHSKMIIIDKLALVDGSFNWFSASREEDYPYYNWDTSIAFYGEDIGEMIENRLGLLEERVINKSSLKSTID
ncbi:AAA domain-containing protein [Isobaculum melis]|uniref:Part of AAA domain-containing protein n=1 Tax=Isobaculum melis TaxID=142588 RepID=A0A1H9Q1S5_9LACT|nr:AAA domain-containing protein [Isobaculum melis]SER54358.1 Part of AAA domain-containing protein [Isobaculum melis]